MHPRLNNTAAPTTAPARLRLLPRAQSQLQNHSPLTTHHSPLTAHRAGFTLVELLVVMTILIVLTTLVLAAFQRDDTDRLSASGRLVQSYLVGARSQAIKDGQNRGVRFTRSANDPWVIDSMVYIGATEHLTGTVDITNFSGRWYIANTSSGEWGRLVQRTIPLVGGGTWTLNPNGRDLLRFGARIELPAGTGNWYTVRFAEDVNLNGTLDAGEDLNGNMALDYLPDVLVLNSHYARSTYDPVSGTYFAQPALNVPYHMELAATVLPNKLPVQLDRGIVIDLAGSQVPADWLTGGYMDILFDPRGNPTGDVVADGVISLYLTTLEDVELTRNLFVDHPANNTASPLLPPVVPANVPPNIAPGAPQVPKVDPRALTLFTQTGQVIVSQIDFTDNPVDYRADVPFRFARRGREAK